jgi:Fe2+ transport system protein FeoA
VVSNLLRGILLVISFDRRFIQYFNKGMFMVFGEMLYQTLVSNSLIPLYSAKSGQWLKIYSLPKGLLRAQFIRFGIHEGERVQCIERLPGGTIVLQKNRQQIAIGHLLAKQIFVFILE